ncbi:MAG TPA: arylamine N-acetyltransferase [Mycobacterium sp.]|uniref:arylamine N-acetyltransferase family protein n=1 Tax=Mycobacterium sp. TaxID=1785 RepID=UPI002B760093|nr:arylamine N-acetyltransferase [Mycobacterium sp.]HME77601.1 arylamine N-acetyltransferase [Mycobacterium sp.]
MTLDLDGYFERIDYHGAAEPTLDVLQDLITAHTRTIPFENLDPLLGEPIDDLSPEALTDKLVRRLRGGYCYEQNGLMGYVLEELGFGVRRFGARVVWTLAPDAPIGSQTHTLLAVTLPGGQQPYLVDVGFGGQTPTSPIDLKVGSWYVSTHPSSHFVTSLMASLVTADGRCNLSGRNLAIHHRGGTEKIRLDDASAVVDTLTDRFGINVADAGERTVLEARIDEVAP